MNKGTIITLEDGSTVWTPFTITEIGKASSAKLNESLIPIEEKRNQDRITELKEQIKDAEMRVTDASLLSWAYENSPDIDMLEQLKQELSLFE